MASTARLGLKLQKVVLFPRRLPGRNGLYSPLGIETVVIHNIQTVANLVGMASTARLGLKQFFLARNHQKS